MKSIEELQKDLLLEFNELTERVDRLTAFMGSDEYASLPDEKAWLLESQHKAMERYKSILNARLNQVVIERMVGIPF